MSEKNWCQATARQVAEGRLTEKDLITTPDRKWGNELNKWAKLCRDPSLKRLHQLEAQGRVKEKMRQTQDGARHKALMEKLRREAESGMYVSPQQQRDLAQLKQSSSTAWPVIKTSCQTAVKMLEKAKSQSNVNPHIQVWNGKLSKTLHNFLSTAKKWTERGKNAIDVYNAFVALQKVDPSLAAKNPKAYAAQMGSALRGIGKALKALPAPFGSYGEFLAKSGDFFVNMSSALIPGQRRSLRDYAPGGRFYNPYDRVFTGT